MALPPYKEFPPGTGSTTIINQGGGGGPSTFKVVADKSAVAALSDTDFGGEAANNAVVVRNWSGVPEADNDPRTALLVSDASSVPAWRKAPATNFGANAAFVITQRAPVDAINDLGIVAAGNTPADATSNSAIMNDFLANEENRQIIFRISEGKDPVNTGADRFGFSAEMSIPKHKHFEFIGKGGRPRLDCYYDTGQETDAMFRFVPGGGTGEVGHAIFRNLDMRNTAFDGSTPRTSIWGPVIACTASTPIPQLIVDHCSGRTWGWWCMLEDMAFSIQPVFRDMLTGGGGALYVTPQPAENYSNAVMKLDGWRHIHTAGTGLGAMFFLWACRGAELDKCIIEGQPGFRPEGWLGMGAGTMADYEGAIALTIYHTGPQGVKLNNCHFEENFSKVDWDTFNLPNAYSTILAGQGSSDGLASHVHISGGTEIGQRVRIGLAPTDTFPAAATSQHQVKVTIDNYILNVNKFTPTEGDDDEFWDVRDDGLVVIHDAQCFGYGELEQFRRIQPKNIELAGEVAIYNYNNNNHFVSDGDRIRSVSARRKPDLLYRYEGGYLDNVWGQFTAVSQSYNMAYPIPHYSPEVGSTLLFRRRVDNSVANERLNWEHDYIASQMRTVAAVLDGKPLFIHFAFRFPNGDWPTDWDIQDMLDGLTTYTDGDWVYAYGSRFLSSGGTINFPRMRVIINTVSPEVMEIGAMSVSLHDVSELHFPKLPMNALNQQYVNSGDEPYGGTWPVGARLLVPNPTASNPAEYICTQAGTGVRVDTTGDATNGDSTITTVGSTTGLFDNLMIRVGEIKERVSGTPNPSDFDVDRPLKLVTGTTQTIRAEDQLDFTGTSTNGSPILTGMANTTIAGLGLETLMAGSYVSHPGFSGTRRVIERDLGAGTITLDANANSNQTDGVLENVPAVWSAGAALSA